MNLGNETSRKYIALVPTIFLTPFLIGITIFFLIFYYPRNEFNIQEWEKNVEERYEMSENIIKTELLIGKTKDEVIELLGEKFYSYNENHIAYGLGFVPGLFNIDPDVLDIYFENGKVKKVGQHET